MSAGTDDRPPRKMVTVNGIDTRMPTAISAGKALCALANQCTGWAIRPSASKLWLTIPNSSLNAQRQTTAVIVSETAHGSMMMVRARPRPWKS